MSPNGSVSVARLANEAGLVPINLAADLIE